MTHTNFKQLNPFELKTAISNLINKINSTDDMRNCLSDFDELDAQTDKKVIAKILFKELVSVEESKVSLVCFLLEHFVPKEDLIPKLWETLKNQNLSTEIKIIILNLLREWDSDWSYETCEDYLDDTTELLDANTKQLLNSAIINPEVQIDFMDFLASLNTQDKITLLNSFSKDFEEDALANILIPVFVSNPNSPEGKEALELLADTKSQLALHTLEEMKPLTEGELLQRIKKSLSTIKISGMRQDNTKDFYKRILSNSKPHQFYVTYPDGHGDMAMIFTRLSEEGKIRFVSVVCNVDFGIRDCFGFFDISEFESSKILERFLRDEKTVSVTPEVFKNILYNAELLTISTHKNSWKLPYEYVCWKNLLIDIDAKLDTFENINKASIAQIGIDTSIIPKLDDMNISKHWFLDYEYSDEFVELLKDLKTTEPDDIIEKHYDKVFYEEEKTSWDRKLELCAYIKLTKDKIEEAEIIYSILNSTEVKEELYKDILRRSIYEYLMLIKYDSKVEHHSLTIDDIEGKIKYIEEKWVHNV